MNHFGNQLRDLENRPRIFDSGPHTLDKIGNFTPPLGGGEGGWGGLREDQGGNRRGGGGPSRHGSQVGEGVPSHIYGISQSRIKLI